MWDISLSCIWKKSKKKMAQGQRNYQVSQAELQEWWRYSSLICKTSAVKVIGINKSVNILAHHFWKLQMHDQGEKNDDAVTAARHASLHVSLPGSVAPLPPALPRSSFRLKSLCCILCLTLEKKKLGELETRSSLSPQRCFFPGSVCSHTEFSLGVSV